MAASSNNIDEVVTATEYFQYHVNKLLAILQPSFYCLKLVIRVLVHGPDGSGKRILAKMAAKELNMNFCEARVADLFDENIIGTEKKIKATISKLATSMPCIIYLTGYEIFNRLEDLDLDRIDYCLKECLEELIIEQTSQPVVFIAATNDINLVRRTRLYDIFHHELPMKSPSLTQATELVQQIKSFIDLNIESLDIVQQCTRGEYYLGNLIDSIARFQTGDVELDEITSKGTSGLITETRWEDVGGLSHVKQEVMDTIQLYMDYPQLRRSGLKRTGILLHGPPGTGKTLIAKAVATECNLNFINVKGPEMLNKYVGQSEDNIRELFKKARESSPSIVFFDEFDSLAPNRGQVGDSGGVMDRIVSQLLAEMDGTNKNDDVFVIGATNRVDLVDSSLLRPGRFDKIIMVNLPTGKKSRVEIMRALTRKMNLSNDVDIEELEQIVPQNFSGAQFKGLCSRALQRAFDRCVEQVESGLATEDDVDIVINMKDFTESINE